MVRKKQTSEDSGRILVAHPDEDVLKHVVRSLENKAYFPTVSMSGDKALELLRLQRFHAVLYGAAVKDVTSATFFNIVRENPLLEHLPLILLEAKRGELAEATDDSVDLRDSAICLERAEKDFYPSLIKKIESAMRFRLDPQTKLLSGASLNRKLSHLCDKSELPWNFILIKIFGVKAYDVHMGYDEGDDMLRAAAESIRNVVEEVGEPKDFAGRISGSYFCVATTLKNPDALCRKIINTVNTSFRRFYSPYEWVKGYVTVEDEKHKGNYHLAETMLACISVPGRWNHNYSYLKDIADEILKRVEREDDGYRIHSLRTGQ